MKLTTVRNLLACALSLQLGLSAATSPAIGTALANGAFRLDQASVSGNATLFEGSILETQKVSSSVQLNSGARLSLKADSRARLFGDRLVLEKGASQFENSTAFRLVALGLTVQPEQSSSTGQVVFEGPRRIRVLSTGGSLRVLNANGVLVANLAPGAALAFEPQQGPSNVTRIVGTVSHNGTHYVITDEVAKVTIEVVGLNINEFAGKRVEVLGAMDPTATPVSGATQVVRAREIHPLDGSKKEAVAVAAGAGGATAGGTIAGVSVTTATIVGGAAAGAAIGGLAAADALPGQGESGSNSR